MIFAAYAGIGKLRVCRIVGLLGDCPGGGNENVMEYLLRKLLAFKMQLMPSSD